MVDFSNNGGRNISLIQGMPESWFNGENSAWNSLPTTPKSIDGYSKYTARIASRYPEIVDTIEYLNEPNKPAANYPAADYVNLAMRTTVRLAKAGYNGNIDVFSFYNFRQKEWSEESYENGIYPYMTSISEHAYGFGYGPQCADKGACERRSLEEYRRYFSEYLIGFENMELVSTGNIMGIRESRRIIGDYILNLEDYNSNAVFDDEIGRYCYVVDIHAKSQENLEKMLEKVKKYKEGDNYGIPYRALVPKGIDNLLVAGKCISCDRYILGSIRVMPGCFITGQAAGTAAAIMASEDKDSRSVDIRKLQKRLKKDGAYLPNCKI